MTPTDNARTALYEVRRDGQRRAGPFTNNEAFQWLLNHQGQSVHHATTYEGWEIREVDPEVDTFLFQFGEGTDYDTPISVLGPWFCDFELADGTVIWGRLIGYGEDGEGWVIKPADPESDIWPDNQDNDEINVPFDQLIKVVLS